jgi:hypothetical protein
MIRPCEQIGRGQANDVKGIKGRHEAHLKERDDNPIPLADGLEVEVFGMEQQILQDRGQRAIMTHASLLAGRLLFDQEVSQWEDIRMLLRPSPGVAESGEIYGKVVSVAPVGDGVEAWVRFTSVFSEANKMLRDLMGSVESSGQQT